MNLAINWTANSQLIDGWSTPNLYGLLFVSGLAIGFYVIKRIYKAENLSDDWLDKLLIYMVFATIVGARLGHCLFYDPAYYLSHPIEILKVWEGGLASHGGAIAILIALYIYSKKVTKKPMLWILDRIVAPIAIASASIRLGNLVNHEIVGKPTGSDWGFKFLRRDLDIAQAAKATGLDPYEQVDKIYKVVGDNQEKYADLWNMIPARHPAQLYEAISYITIFLILMFLFWKTDLKRKSGLLFSIFLILLFTARLLIEFVKVGQADRDAGMLLNTGQWLSVPFILAGIVLFIYANRKKEETL